MENLIDVLQKECTEYDRLLHLSQKKTPLIVNGDLTALQQVTEEEQSTVGVISHLDSRRDEVMKDIANVLNKDVANLKVSALVRMLGERPGEQKLLQDARERLANSAKELKRVNEQNRDLLIGALELVEFDMNLLQALRKGPQTANYDHGTYSGAALSVDTSSFDAKQ
jgi:flagellar biosynthesis/type III secretory pathway chaperone